MNKSSAITPPKINQAAGITYFYFLCQKDGLRIKSTDNRVFFMADKDLQQYYFYLKSVASG